LAEQALALARAGNDERGIGYALLNLATVAWERGEGDRVSSLADEALSRFRRLGERRGAAGCPILLAKLGVESRTAAAALAFREGLI
jgi:hypothetical protein